MDKWRGGIVGNFINNQNKISESREAHTITPLTNAKSSLLVKKIVAIVFVGVLLILWPTTTQAEDAILTDLHKYHQPTLNENVLYINLMNPSERFRKNFDEQIAFGEGPGGGQIRKPWMKLATHISKDHNLYVEVEILDGVGWAYFDNDDVDCPWCTGSSRNPCGRNPQYRCETKLQLYKGSEKVAEYSLSQVYHYVIDREYYYINWGARSRWYGTINLNGLTEGTYVLRVQSYWVREYDYYKYEQRYNSMSLTINIFYATAYPKKTYNYGLPGEKVSIVLRVRGPHRNVAAALYDPTTHRWLSVPSPKKIAEEDTPFGNESIYEVNYGIPQSAQLGSVYELQFRVTYPDDSAQDVMTFIVVGEDPDRSTQIEPPPELQYVCPFLVNPVWALAGQTATIGCYDNPGDDFTVVQGTVFIPQVGITPLEQMNEQHFVASTRVPSVEGIYNAIYELKVRNSQGRSYTVNGSQQIVVTSTPEELYCPPPGDGVSSFPDSEGRVRLRLIR